MNDDFDDTDPNDFSRPYVVPVMSKDEIHLEFIRQWYECLSWNEDYEKYCDVKRDGDTETCFQLERKFPRIAEVFTDWGDIFNGQPYPDWLGQRRHLFFASEPTVQFGDDGGKTGGLTITVPRGLSKADLNRLLKVFVAKNEELLCRPKYTITGHLTVEKLLTLSRSAFAYDLHNGDDVEIHEKHRDQKGMQEYSYTNVARSFLDNAVMYRTFGLGINGDIWSKPPLIPKGKDTWSYDDLLKYAQTVGDWIGYYKKCIAGTIEGVFPAKT